MTNIQRKGYSLIEILVVIAILAILIGLVLSAVQRVRSSAVLTASKNNLRQIILATHQLSDQKDGKIGGLANINMPTKGLYTEQPLFHVLLPWTVGPHVFHIPADPNPTMEQVLDLYEPRVPMYRSPGDPTLNNDPVWLHRSSDLGATGIGRQDCSYACNFLAFDGVISFPFSIPDGTTNTIAFSERYFLCSKPNAQYMQYGAVVPPKNVNSSERRATFADKPWRDVVPEFDAATKQTLCSVRGMTFQVRPTTETADSRLLQTPFSQGLPVAMFDGSVKVISPGVAENIFWSAVTPNGGETAGLD